MRKSSQARALKKETRDVPSNEEWIGEVKTIASIWPGTTQEKSDELPERNLGIGMPSFEALKMLGSIIHAYIAHLVREDNNIQPQLYKYPALDGYYYLKIFFTDKIVDILRQSDWRSDIEISSRKYLKNEEDKRALQRAVYMVIDYLDNMDTEEHIEKSSVRGKYRKASERPRPDLAANAEPNRLKTQFKLRLEPELIERIDNRAKAEGMTRQDWAEQVFKQAIDN